MPKFDRVHNPICHSAPFTIENGSEEGDYVQSRVTGEKWLWIRIPKTATIAYREIFFPEISEHMIQSHVPLKSFFDWKYAFTVVRDPMSRFKSAIGHLTGSNRAHLNIQFTDTDDLVEFFASVYSTLKENFDDYAPGWVNETFKPYNVTCEQCGMYVPGFIYSLFTSQMYWAYHPKVRVFKYEDLSAFNSFIETELGYSTAKLKKRNATDKNTLAHLDFTDPRIVELVKKIYKIDYEAFNYGS